MTVKKSSHAAKNTKTKKIKTTNTTRQYDLVLFGASGYTGGLTAEYLAQCGEVPPNKLALAGRSLSKLKAVRQQLAAINPRYDKVALLQADVSTPESLTVIAKATKVVITTVGPYIFYGEPLLAACAKTGTHYVDITGEPEFVDKMFVAYDGIARQNGAKIVNCCGFDSIPHDAGVWFTIEQVNKFLGARAGQQRVEIRGYVHSTGGTFSGGTFHSAINAFARARDYLAWRREHISLLKPPSSLNRAAPLPMRIHKVAALGGWGIPLPTIDPQIVVRTARSNSSYGPDFRYGHYALVKSLPTGLAGIAGVAALFAAAQIKPLRERLLQLRQPGQGPSADRRARSSFSVDFFADIEGVKLSKLHTRVSGGDPGYGETAKMLAETALALAYDSGLPGHSGVITPMLATGAKLIARLQKANLRFEVL